MPNATQPCDCPTNMPAQQCIRYCTGECDGPDDTPASATPSHDNAEPDDGFAGAVIPSALGPTPETVRQRLKRVYPEHYVRIITEANRQNGSESTATLLGYDAAEYYCALAALFIWDRAPEGYVFWCELARREQS